jgi:predicted membrane-bound spermidine synthase
MLLKLASSHLASRIIGADFLGTCLGSVAFPLFLYPHLGLVGTATITAAANVVVALSLAARQQKTAWLVAVPLLLMPVVYFYFAGQETQIVATFYRKFWL